MKEKLGKVEISPGGFSEIKFNDSAGNECILSSLSNAVLLGRYDVNGVVMELDADKAKALVYQLAHWIDTGTLSDDPPDSVLKEPVSDLPEEDGQDCALDRPTTYRKLIGLLNDMREGSQDNILYNCRTKDFDKAHELAMGISIIDSLIDDIEYNATHEEGEEDS